ncbi:leucine-rich repeat receptor-like serine/threonine-protein kinase BAM1 [Ziziphus jujuba]|uniref:Leucine-rich repeat receptor-like serine/threonine-protein kinase BAM1 n=1 Tax=Ziziphus jujuba TaxID=326968 RepID=A0A6P4A9L5_ZIZJJ|nr:leucine-rich repeat receptor-like serine/threonine-protein kinase BAM1 [Ziziphus jujuba]
MSRFISLLLLLLLKFFFSTHIHLVHGLTSPSDVSALKAFKASIKTSSIPQWSCLASWDFTTDPCAFPRRTHFTCGLSCSPDSTRITQITLDPAGYSGTLSPFISKLTQLTVLDLADNSFYGPIPSSISSLSNLQTLTLRSNQFSGSIPPSVTQLKSLEAFDLSHNSLTGFLPSSINSLSNLRRLDLSFNKLTGSIPKLPSNLLELAMKGNSLSGSLTKSSFDGLTGLEVVELSENSITGTLEAWFFLLPSLQQVDLANNSLTRVEIWSPGRSSSSDLVAVDLGFNRIEGYVPVNFVGYPLLSSLSLRYNRLRGKIPLEYSQKKSLRRLYLDGNFLIGQPPPAFFSGQSGVSGSLGDNCLQSCPTASQLCLPSQKPNSICKQAYGGKPKS